MQVHSRISLAAMMFCTTFLSAPSEELGGESGGGAGAGGRGLGPASCLSTLHCLVLPQDELYPGLSEPSFTQVRAHSFIGDMLLDVRGGACHDRDSGGIWDRVRRRRSRSASPLPSKTPKSPCSDSLKGPTLPMATVDIENPEISTGHRFHSNSQVNNIIHSTFKREKKGKGKKKRLTKADIGTQSNFQHIGHVGWDPNTGFDLNNLDPELKHLFDMCGISEAQLKDKETSKVIYDFIEKKGGVEAVKNELRRQGPPCIEKRREPPNGPTLPMATVDIENPEISTGHRFHSNSQVNNIIHSTFKREKKGKGKKKRLTKADIGTQSNFQHIGHVGWDPNTGFDLNNLDPELKNLFDMCGISEAQLKDKETSKVIYDFIEKKGGVEAVKNELRRQSGPHESALCVASEKDN
ncbi:uncharacterized protein LOC133472256 isoform X5 [Phyllopteryx taeniolatus]|uniref:uncharacterized protein LOC133472256 isoform X5 n=1 Tax=Phyllopteryx taeniolatus TaxID=161469 RepID=UPI002AD4DECC|nr:uncharacterized protein LOC133472256 isoform X5 [Phyllopteryx taeniolatus]